MIKDAPVAVSYCRYHEILGFGFAMNSTSITRLLDSVTFCVKLLNADKIGPTNEIK